ncbi:methyltransferase domain-containing protein [Candidatus Parcubacteria bacterium]|nr:MAG: methyltransferase domain-containing protein [Candidatus Parcubacteria bacterium]
MPESSERTTAATVPTRAEPPPPPGSGGFLHPDKTIAAFDLRPGMIVADFGCGGGYFSIPAARAVGENGKVYALDVQKNALAALKAKVAAEHLPQLEPVWADLERPDGSHLPQSAVDFVIIANILFQAEKRDAVVAEARRVLRSGGMLAIVEWDDTPFPAGPPMILRVPRAEAKQLAAKTGFELVREFDAGSHHYGMLFTKPRT